MLPVVYNERRISRQSIDTRQVLLNNLLIKSTVIFYVTNTMLLNADGTSLMPRKQWFDQCINEAMITLQTHAFNSLKETVRQYMLEYLGAEIQLDDALWDIYFKPLTSLDFYHSLEMCLVEGGHITPLRALGEGVQTPLFCHTKCLQPTKHQWLYSYDRRAGIVYAPPYEAWFL